jgi:hypothetical protein
MIALSPAVFAFSPTVMDAKNIKSISEVEANKRGRFR